MPTDGASPARLMLLMVVLVAILGAILLSWAGAIVAWASGRRLLPPATPRRVPWGALTVVAVMLLWVGAQIGIEAGYMAAAGKIHRTAPVAATPGKPAASSIKIDAPSGRDTIAMITVVNVLLLVAIPALVAVASGARASDLGITRSGVLKNAARGVVAALLVMPLVYVVLGFSSLLWRATQENEHPLLKALREDPSGRTAVLGFIAAVILAPAVEELMFRGVFLGWLQSLFDRPQPPDELEVVEISGFDEPKEPPAIPVQASKGREHPGAIAAFLPNVIVSMVFAGLHFGQWPAPLPLFVLSLTLGELMRRTHSLWGPIALHATFNGMSTSLLLLLIWSGVKLPERPSAKEVRTIKTSSKLQTNQPINQPIKADRR